MRTPRTARRRQRETMPLAEAEPAMAENRLRNKLCGGALDRARLKLIAGMSRGRVSEILSVSWIIPPQLPLEVSCFNHSSKSAGNEKFEILQSAPQTTPLPAPSATRF